MAVEDPILETTRSDVPFQVGIIPVRIQELLSGGTADDVWGVY